MPPLISHCLVALCIVAALPAVSPAQVAEEHELITKVRSLMEISETPGVALAIVRKKGDAIVAGIGNRTLDGEGAVDANTLFAIGSSTKAFTALALGLQVHQGKAQWEDLVSHHLPGFALNDPFASSAINLEDLLTHRSGLPRHDLTWYGGEGTRAELVAGLQHLEPNKPFRAAWQYQNLMYVTAGHVAGQIAGTDWETEVQQNILQPLGMQRTLMHIADLPGQENCASGHALKDEAIEVVPYRTLQAAGPAGSICSSANDMAQWLRLWTGDRKLENRSRFSKALLKDLRTPRISMPPLLKIKGIGALSYAMGWMVGDYRGHPVVFHGGNIDGFSAMVAFFPDDQLGVVVLSNLNGDTLPNLVPFLVADHLFELKPNRWKGMLRAAKLQRALAAQAMKGLKKRGPLPLTYPSGPLKDFTGSYSHPAYGQAQITLVEGELQLAYHGETAILKHHHYDDFATESSARLKARLHFMRDRYGIIQAAEVPLEAMAAPIRFERVPDERLRDPAVRAKILGRWSIGPQVLTVSAQEDGHLRITIPPDQVYRLAEGPGPLLRYEGLPNHRIEVRFDTDNTPTLIFHEPAHSFEGKPRDQ